MLSLLIFLMVQQGVSAIKFDRNFIGIELDENHFNDAKQRIESTQLKLDM